MKKRRLTLVLVAGRAAAAYYVYARPPSALVLTGIVTTNDVVVSPQIGGQIDQLLVDEGDQVKKDQLLAVIAPDELMAESAYYDAERRRADLAGRGERSGAALSGAPDRRSDPAGRIDARRDRSRRSMAAAADLENARLTFARTAEPVAAGRRVAAGARPGAHGVRRRAGEARRAQAGRSRRSARPSRSRARTPSRSAMRRSQVQHQPAAAGGGRRAAHEGRRAARLHRDPGADRRHRRRARRAGRRSRQSRPADRDAHQSRRSLGPRRRRGDLHRSRARRRHADRPAAVRRRAARARSSTAASTPSFATQRDVSRTKRDIKTFEVRLRVDNQRPAARRRHDGVRAAAASASRG